MRRILNIGLPAAGENISYWIAFMVVTTFIARMGAAQLATQTYTMNINRWVILLSVSIGLGTEILIGHLIGAGLFEAAYRELLRSLRIAFCCAFGGMAVLGLLAPWLLGVFTSTPAIIASGTVLIRMGLLLEPGRVFNVVVINALRATGDARFPVIVGAICMWGIWVPFAWFLGLKLGLGLVGIWISLICDEWTARPAHVLPLAESGNGFLPPNAAAPAPAKKPSPTPKAPPRRKAEHRHSLTTPCSLKQFPIAPCLCQHVAAVARARCVSYL